MSAPVVRRGAALTLAPLLWSLLLGALMLGPALAPGFVLLRDMVWVPDLPLRAGDLGLGSALPRAVPSDAVVAVLDEVIPGMLLQKLVLLGSLMAAGAGAAAMVGGPLVPRLVASSLAVWNPFVVERLGMGHWPVLVGYAALPWLVLGGRRWHAGRMPAWLPWVLVAGSLSANAGLASALALLLSARRARALLLVAGANAPWIVAGLTHTGAALDASGYQAFSTAGDGLPAPLAVLTLGGIWNSDVVPGSRHGVLVWVGLVVLLALAAAGARRWWSRTPRAEATALIALWACGVLVAWLSALTPGLLRAIGQAVPGGGLLRDGSRSLGLAMPLLVTLVAAGVEELRSQVPRRAAAISLALAATLLPLALLPDAAWGLRHDLAAVDYPREWTEVARWVPAGSGAAAIVPLSNYRAPAWNGARPVIDPLARLLPVDTTIDDDLVVDGAAVPGEDPSARRLREALAASTPVARAARLRAAGFRWLVVERDAGRAPDVAGTVVHQGTRLLVVRLVGAVATPARPDPWLQGLAWLAFLLVVTLGVVRMATLWPRPASLGD